MLKRIDVADVQLGMFIHKLEGSWFKHPFWKSKFLLDDPETLENLRFSDVDGVIIDIAKGKDAQPFHRVETPRAKPPAEAPRRSPIQRRRQPVSAAAAPPVDLRSTRPQGMAREFGHATKVAEKSRKVVSKVFLESRLGKAIKAAHVEPVIEDIFASVQRNPHAFNGLMRCKRDNEYIYRHALAVSALMISLARHCKMPPETIREAGMAGLLMDVGIAHLPVDLAEYGGDYRNIDRRIFEQHVALGHQILSVGGGVPQAVLDVCLRHHEMIDGSGYPAKLAGAGIDTLSRMAAICDFYDSMVSDTAEGVGMNPASAIGQMAMMKGWFDPEILQSFIETMGIYPIGSVVMLRSGRLAMVVDQDPADPSLPKVRTFYSTQALRFVQPEDIALAQAYGADGIEGIADPGAYGIQDFMALRERLFGAAAKGG